MLGHMECKRCGCEVDRETDRELMKTYPWYCPACDTNLSSVGVTFVENAPFEQVRWGFVDEDTIVTAWNVEDVFKVAPELTIEDARNVLATALDNHDANIGIKVMSYNGWANRETWMVAFHHGEMFAEIAEDAVGRGDGGPHELAEEFRTAVFEIEEVDSILNVSGVVSELLANALDQIDWLDLAETHWADAINARED